jgi:hypothetical protein
MDKLQKVDLIETDNMVLILSIDGKKISLGFIEMKLTKFATTNDGSTEYRCKFELN